MDIFPVFPLSLVAFPRETVNLHIFEARYIQLINECDAEGITFGIPLFFEKKLYTVGTEMRLTDIVERYPDGKMDVRVEGCGRFRCISKLFIPKDKLYSAVEMERFDGSDDTNIILQEKAYEALCELHNAANIKGKLPNSASALHTYQVAHFAGFSPAQKVELLSIPDEINRLSFLIEHLELLLPTFKMMQELKDRAKMNGHFRVVSSDF